MAQEPLTQTLAQALADHRQRLVILPAFQAFASGTLPLPSYLGMLQALAIILDALEPVCHDSRHRLVVAVWSPELGRRELIAHDLVRLQQVSAPLPAATGALLRAHALAESIRQAAIYDPAALPGYLYGLLDWPASLLTLAGPPGPAAAQHYLQQNAGADRSRLTRRLVAAATTVEQRVRVLAAVGETFEALAQIGATLHPLVSQPLRDLASALNPSAGMHHIPDDLREIRAALRAGAISWHRCPYYAWRYGGRGRAFTHSDSAWLTTLAAYPWEEALRQVAWLGRVLAARGMPQWLLEQHLEVLYHELAAGVPEKRDSYAVLCGAAVQLRAVRQAHLDDEQLQACSQDFDAHASKLWVRRLPGSGGLLAAAVADEQAGIANAVSSMQRWMCDPQRFPRVWISAVERTVRQAHAIARP